MLLRQCIERSTVGLAFIASLLSAHLAIAQAPPSAEQPWAIPESASRRAAALGDTGLAVPHKQYDLAALVDLAERENPNTRAAWEVAREAAAGIGLAESAYLPQLSLQAIGGFQHTPLPMPKNLVPAGYFVSDTREVIPALALKWLLFDFGRRDAQLQAARADSFVANVAFTGAHQKLIFDVSQAYFDLGAARGQAPCRAEGLEYRSYHSGCRHRQAEQRPRHRGCGGAGAATNGSSTLYAGSSRRRRENRARKSHCGPRSARCYGNRGDG